MLFYLQLLHSVVIEVFLFLYFMVEKETCNKLR